MTLEDIIEEIVGDIRDEYDGKPPAPSAQALPDGDMIADARLTIAELNELLDVELPEDDDYDTLGGYISAQAGRIPQAGEHLVTEHLDLEILAADPRRVMKAKIRKLAEPPAHPGD